MKLLARHTRIFSHFSWEVWLLAVALAFFAWQVCHPTLALYLLGNYVILATCFFGVLVFVLLFTILQYFQNKDKSYLFYSIYLGFSLLYFLRSSQNVLWLLTGNKGLILMGRWDDFSHRWGGEFYLSLLLMASYCLFIQHFFDMKKNFPRLHRWVNMGYWLFLAYAVLYILLMWANGFSALVETLAKFSLALPALYVLTCIYQQQNRLYNLILTGTFLLLAGAATSGILYLLLKDSIAHLSLNEAGLRTSKALLVYLQLGTLCEILLFSTALGYKSLLTEREKNQALLDAAEARRLHDLDQVKTRLYTNITHEFRTPLTLILGLANQLESRGGVQFPSTQDGLNPAATIRRNGQQLLNLVNQMLDLAKLEGGNLPVKMVQGDVIVFLKYLLESFHSLADAKKIHLHFEARMDSFFMDFDEEKLRQIVSNLLSNAIKFTPEGGSVRLRAVNTGSADNTFQIQVADSGMGITPEDLPYVFDRFFQVETSAISSPRANSTGSGGTGIGLTLTKELVKLLGGNIEVESQPGSGTTFTVCLPVNRQAEIVGATLAVASDFAPILADSKTTANGQLLPRHPDSERPQGSPLLLLVEDNEDVLRYLTAILKNDYRLETAPHGKAGLEKAFDLLPDLILSDVMMPGMDGYELCQHLKNDLRTSHVPVVLLTAKADFDSRLEGLELGADAYLAKPFEERELQVVLRKLLKIRENLRRLYTSGEFIAAAARLVSTDSADKSNPEEAAKALSTAGADSAAALNEQFLNTLLQAVESHLNDPALSIETLASLLHMDYSTLYRKVKALTDMPPSEYIRHVRLHRAAQMMLGKPAWSISRISLEVGFNSLPHFSREFKKTMGCGAKEWREAELRKQVAEMSTNSTNNSA